MDSQQMMNIDPALLAKLQQNPAWISTQTPDTVANANYRQMSKDWSPPMRIVYEAVKAGYTDTTQPPVTVDMSPKVWQSAFNTLVGKGALTVLPTEELQVKQ